MNCNNTERINYYNNDIDECDECDEDEMISKAQDYYFEARYDDAIEVLNKIEKEDGAIYQMIVMCYCEKKEYQKAFENAKKWRAIAKRDTALQSRKALMNMSYLCDEKEVMREVSDKMIQWNEDLSDVILLRLDMFPDEKDTVIGTIESKIKAKELREEEVMILSEVLRVLSEKQNKGNDHMNEIGEQAYTYGVLTKVVMLINGIGDNDKTQCLSIWKGLENKNNQIVNSIRMMEGTPIAQHGIHMVIRKHGKMNEEVD
ncbi:hypothetical protein EDI_063480 [Entamoeba dispar SAW760]|uniref:Tetratricopeptide repeat protein n=1 Tax=Entamoeba dispar (strain ATCC PRA-260 / SAW760) TaxID=370354 RepID=B0E9V6_ENTDS|nr:uncharacterized protein EDI_063480 [Entamoeba dispar SAW760]EDR28675.1 hypothetical protein EDI_063480 [Entamoeba dispar SAW760]|eukprot:EDR28675.1 hypothetical protein EDI_063480 [Entamoeba dispar SAW760]